MKLFLFASLGLMVTSGQILAADPVRCDGLLAPAEAFPDLTNEFDAYLKQLLELGMLTSNAFGDFVENLAAGRLVNPIHPQTALRDAARLIHHQNIEQFFAMGRLDQKKLLQLVQAAWSRRRIEQTERSETETQTQYLYRKIQFYPVPPGHFLMDRMGGFDEKAEVTLSHPIEVMSTPVTQKMWVDLMGENPSAFMEEKESSEGDNDGLHVKMLPDHPVESLTWWSALVYANKLSELRGLRPAYDLSDIEFLDVSEQAPRGGERRPLKNLTEIFNAAARGTLGTFDESIAPRINAPGEDIYLAKGFRLPTEAEQQYMLKGAGKAQTAFYFGESQNALRRHAWFSENSNKMTHAVGQLEPLVVNGKLFYDLVGNVREWRNNFWLIAFSSGYFFMISELRQHAREHLEPQIFLVA